MNKENEDTQEKPLICTHSNYSNQPEQLNSLCWALQA